LIYYGDVSKYSNVDWVQTVKTDWPAKGKPANEYYLDGNPDSPNPPFFYSKDGQDRFLAERNGYNRGGEFFTDRPGRSGKGRDFYWEAKLSLVGQRNGKYETIATFTYGFVYYNNFLYLMPFQMRSSNKNQTFIGNLKN